MALQEDPSIQLCLIKNSFEKETIDIEAIKPKAYHATNFENVENTLDVKLIPITSFPPSMVEGYDELQKLKENLGNIDSSINRAVNPFESIGNSIFMSRAGVKLANIDAVYQLNGSLANIFSLQSEAPNTYTTPLTFCDIAGGPGAFSEYIFWRNPSSSGYGITLKNVKGLDWSTKLDKYNFTPFNGGDGTGNLYTNWKEFEFYILENNSGGVNLSVADGGFEVEGKDFSRQEFLSSRLITVELYLGFACIKEGGSFVCKVFDTVTKYMYDIIYALSLAFDEIIMFKPMSSRPANGERYLVCRGRNEDIEIPRRIFTQVINSFTDDTYVSQVFNVLPQNYMDWMDEQNMLSIDRQNYYVDHIIRSARGEEIEMYVYNNNKALLLWSLPGNIEKTKKKKHVEIKDNLLDVNYDRIDLYSYKNVKDFMNSKDVTSFPYKRLYYEDDDLVKMFQRLKAYQWRANMTYFNRDNPYEIRNLNMKPVELKYKGLQQAIVNKEEEYLWFNILSDMFSNIEYSRLQSVVIGSKLSSWDYYNNNLENVAKHALTEYGKITPHTLRESLFKLNKEVTSFRPNLVVAVADMFNIRSMLDFSAGWGDRMIGAMAAGIKYTGVDPNVNNVKGYQDIIDFFASQEELGLEADNYNIINSPIEDADLSSVENVDLVMTSPPYFDLEIYSKDKTQSTSRYKTQNDWVKKFLIPAIDKSLSKLNDEGYLVLVINQKSRDETYIQAMLNYVGSKSDMNYLGVISYGRMKGKTLGNPQPMWIWRKSSPYLTLEKIVPSMNYELSRIVKDPITMKNVGTGKPWTKEILSKFINNQSNNNPDYYWRGIQVDGRIEGLIGIHPVSYDEGFFLTIFFHRFSTKKGYGPAATSIILEEFGESRPDVDMVYADTLTSNTAAKKFLSKTGFENIKTVTINGKKYNRYGFALDTNRTLTYLTAFEDLSDAIYEDRLTEWNKISLEKALDIGYADLVATEGSYAWDKRLYNVRANLKYRIDARFMTNKVDLHEILMADEQTKTLIAETYVVEPDSEVDIEGSGTWIWRPEEGRSGEGIHVVINQSELEAVRKSFDSSKKNNRAIISRYIEDPMLLDGRKFHLRILFGVLVTDDTVQTFMFRDGRIGIAKEMFSNNDYTNKNIHDSHMTGEDLLYPRDFPKPDMVESVNKQLVNILSYVTKIMAPDFKHYDEAKAGYELFGCDFMVRKDGTVILIEINFTPGFKNMNKEGIEWMSDIIGNGMIDTVIEPYFNGTEPKYEYTIPVKTVRLR